MHGAAHVESCQGHTYPCPGHLGSPQRSVIVKEALRRRCVGHAILKSSACDCRRRTEQCTYADNTFPESYADLRALAFGIIVVWPIGFPCLEVMLLYVCRRGSRSTTDRSALDRAIGFLHSEYIDSAYYWEIVDFVRRLLLVVRNTYPLIHLKPLVSKARGLPIVPHRAPAF